MGRSWIALGRGVVWVCAGGVAAAAVEDPPPLTPPAASSTPSASASAPAATAPAELPPAVEAKPQGENRPVLVVPGVTTPARTRTRPKPATAPTATAIPSEPADFPALVGPHEMPESPPPPRAIPRSPQTRSSARASTPLTLESVPSDDFTEFQTRPNSELTPAPGRDPNRSQSVVVPPLNSRGRPGLFGRFFPQPSAGERAMPGARGAVTVEPRSDPAADAALKRRIERQIRETVGTRLRYYEVRVVDREVVIRAKAARFWQRRSVRHALESLPGLAGNHARVEMVD